MQTEARVVDLLTRCARVDPEDLAEARDLAPSLQTLTSADLRALGTWLYFNGEPLYDKALNRVLRALDEGG
jgi:hypothetical protein